MANLRAAPRFLWDVIARFFGEGHPNFAAAVTFYTMLSLPPLMALLLLLLGSVVDTAAVQAAVVGQAEELIGPVGGEQVGAILEAARGRGVPTSVTAVLGTVGLLFGATTAFAALQGALDRAWHVKLDPTRGDVRNFIARRVFAFGVLLIVGFLLLASLVVSAALAAFADVLTARFEGSVSALLLWLTSETISFAIIALLFAIMFKRMPDAETHWRDVWVGAAVTALLFTLGKLAIGTYIGRADPASWYGAAGSLAVVLLWLYYSSLILLFGAVFTRVWALRVGRGVELKEGAVEDVGVSGELGVYPDHFSSRAGDGGTAEGRTAEGRGAGDEG